MSAVTDKMERFAAAMGLVRDEAVKAMDSHAPFAGRHEGYAVILEELDELWAEIKRRDPSLVEMRDEAVQVAAMAVRFVVDICAAAS